MSSNDWPSFTCPDKNQPREVNVKYATFYAGEHLFGIPIYLVQEISRPVPIFPVPGHDTRIEGLVNLRGRTSVAINLHQCLYGSPSRGMQGLREKLIILETTEGLPEEAVDLGIEAYEEPLILVVDDMYKITAGETEQYFSTPAHVNDLYVDGVMKIEDHLVTLISIPRLIEDILVESEGESNENRHEKR